MLSLCARAVGHFEVPIKSLSISTRHLNTTPILWDVAWRLANGYPKKWSDRGILTDGPDFSYSNGKPTPYSNGQRRRLLEQKQYAEKIIYLLKVVQFAKRTYQERRRNAEQLKENIIARKLKPKGNLLKKKGSINEAV